ncbi:hypothetical protein OH738_22345 [Streptomyces hirsutus]|uniref:hypothetical protein n=1 Tax=Streptomyces hirsutus TaxID=35620 RepID=UPI0038673B23|nr:hypothetical protein OH738_22345 [Streptomyces hirsutus]
MGIESDQVVYEYLSRVGDVAQQRQLPSATRMRLVAGLRDEIDRRRAKAVVDSPTAVRRIISRMGTPDEVVTAASTGSSGFPGSSGSEGAARGAEGNGGATLGKPESEPATAAVPAQRAGDRAQRAKNVLRRAVPRPRPAGDPTAAPAGPSAPHQAGMDELGDSADQPDWWRVDSSPFGVGDSVPGFIGGVEIPELLKAPPSKDAKDGKDADGADGPGGKGGKVAGPSVPGARTAPQADGAPAAVEAGAGKSGSATRRRLPRLPSGGWSNPLLLVAAGLLVVGAVLGNLFALFIGWVIVYASRRLTQTEIKWAVIVLPGLALTGGAVWLWGRTEERWGTPIADGTMGDAVAETWPWAVRAAAVASALFLIWRSQRPR